MLSDDSQGAGGLGMARLAGRIILLWGWRRALVAFLSGALAVLAQAPYDFFAACFVAFPILVWLLDGATAEPSASFIKRLFPAFETGWWFGFGYFVAGLWWVGGALLVEAESFAWALPLAVLALPALLAIFYGLAATIARLFWTDDIGRIAALAFAFGLVEWLRSFLFTGFPWNPIGFAAMPIPLLMQSASVVGMIGMNALAVFVFAMPALLVSDRHLRTGAVLAVLLVAGHAGFGAWRMSLPPDETSRSLDVRIVQPSIEQGEKWDQTVRDRVFKTLLDLSSQPPAPGREPPQLIVWPETSLPFLLTERPDALVTIGDMLAEGQLLMVGAVRAEDDPASDEGARYYNSVVVINDAGEIVDAVDKVHLVPFGEYLPLADLFAGIGIRKVVSLPLDFSPGGARHAVTVANGIRALPFICYEVIFPDLVARDAGAADLLVNVTNDAWFGDTPGPHQHFRQAQVRAVEVGKPLVRAANTGISGAVDARGRVIDALLLNTRGILEVSIPLSGEPDTMLGFSFGPATLLILASIGCGMTVRQRFRSN
jgi:apolipoprotein N-acyltransferase